MSLGQQDEKAYSKFDKVLTALFDRAGKVRDLDVQMAALKTISLPSVEDDQALLRNQLQRQRAKHGRKFSTLVEKELAKRLPKRQSRAKASLLDVAAKPGYTSVRRAADLRKVVMPFVGRLQEIPFDMETLHKVRIELKTVRYAAEAAGDAGTALTEILKPVQDAIGDWHDWVNLLETADEVLGPLPGHPLMTILRNKVRSHFTAAVAAAKPLAHKLSEEMQLPQGKRPGPVLLRSNITLEANAS
jgi:CHAD domain-containing protein